MSLGYPQTYVELQAIVTTTTTIKMTKQQSKTELHALDCCFTTRKSASDS